MTTAIETTSTKTTHCPELLKEIDEVINECDVYGVKIIRNDDNIVINHFDETESFFDISYGGLKLLEQVLPN